MKPLLTILFLLFIASKLSAGPVFRVEAGPSIGNDIYFYDTMAGYRFRFLGITGFTSGGITTWAYYSQSSGNPFESIYYLQQRFDYRNFFIRLKHHCSHQVMNGNNTSEWWSGDITTISIGYELEVWK